MFTTTATTLIVVVVIVYFVFSHCPLSLNVQRVDVIMERTRTKGIDTELSVSVCDRL